MKAEELMAFDLVMFDRTYPPTEKKPTRLTLQDIISIEQGKECKPIPLTPEILEKNGFIKQDNIYPYYCDYYHTRDRFTIHNARIWHGHILKSVHQLQHALRLCGLTDLADSFII